MNKIQHHRSFLVLTCIGISLATIYSLVQPNAGNRPVPSFRFPERIPLKSWQLIKTKTITIRQTNRDRREKMIPSARSYTYSTDNIPLEVEMRYLVGTRGNVNAEITSQTDIPVEILENADLKQSELIGYYTTFTYQNRAYLASCINSRGSTTVTQKQFSQNRNLHDLQFNILFLWLLGRETIRDRRCLLVTLSIPIENSKPGTAYTILEEIWGNWYEWWQPRFPTL